LKPEQVVECKEEKKKAFFGYE